MVGNGNATGGSEWEKVRESPIPDDFRLKSIRDDAWYLGSAFAVLKNGTNLSLSLHHDDYINVATSDIVSDPYPEKQRLDPETSSLVVTRSGHGTMWPRAFTINLWSGQRWGLFFWGLRILCCFSLKRNNEEIRRLKWEHDLCGNRISSRNKERWPNNAPLE